MEILTIVLAVIVIVLSVWVAMLIQRIRKMFNVIQDQFQLDIESKEWE